MSDRFDKTCGCLLAAAMGDALGSPCETRNTELIRRDLGGGDWVWDYVKPPIDSVASGLEAGLVTDDFSAAWVIAQTLLENGVHVDSEAAIKALLDWKNGDDTHIFYEHFSGPSTRAMINKYEGKPYDTSRDYLFSNNLNQTNGGAMKCWILGCFAPEQIDLAMDEAIIMARASHENIQSLSAAAAIAAGVSEAYRDGASVDSVVAAGIYGAEEGLRRARKIGRESAGASVAKRIEYAVELGLKYKDDFGACVNEITDLIGTGLYANEACPAAFGYFAAGMSPLRGILMAVNSGNDCDTTAIQTGALCGAFYGFQGIENHDHHLSVLQKMNPWINFRNLAERICAVQT